MTRIGTLIRTFPLNGQVILEVAADDEENLVVTTGCKVAIDSVGPLRVIGWTLTSVTGMISILVETPSTYPKAVEVVAILD